MNSGNARAIHLLRGLAIALAAACSILFRYVFTAVSSGFAIILCAVLASIFGAIVFPIPEEERT